MKKKKKEICDTCGGTGEIAFFQGVSRFLLSREECPMCHGLGYHLPEEKESSEDEHGTSNGKQKTTK
jgi:DnaJ-class molecular chaperone